MDTLLKLQDLLKSKRKCGSCTIAESWIYVYGLLLETLMNSPQWLTTAKTLVKKLKTQPFPSFGATQSFANLLIDLAILQKNSACVLELWPQFLFEVIDPYSQDLYLPVIMFKLCRKNTTEINDPALINYALNLLPQLEVNPSNQMIIYSALARAIWISEMPDKKAKTEE